MTDSLSRADDRRAVPHETPALAQPARPTSVALPRLEIGGRNTEPCRGLQVANLGDIAPAPIQWLWPGRLAVGKLTVLAGERGVGKSLAAMGIAATVTRGGAWPCREGGTAHVPEKWAPVFRKGHAPTQESGAHPASSQAGCAPAGNVILLSAEDGLADTLRPRIAAAGGDPGRVDVVPALAARDKSGRRSFDLTRDLAALEGLIIARSDVRLVIIDPVGCYMRGRGAELDVLEAIADMAVRRRLAVLLIAPTSKGRSIARLGAGAFVAAALALVPDRQDSARRLLIPARSNLARSIPALAFRFAERVVGGVAAPQIVWETDPVPARLAQTNLRRDKAGKLTEATTFLRAVLAERIVPAREIETRAVAAGLLAPGLPIGDSWRFRDARALLGITSERIAWPDHVGWAWRLPQANSTTH